MVIQYNDQLLDYRLARTPYFVLPKLAIKSMPKDWQDRFEQLCIEADEAGLETPEYYVFRNLYWTDDACMFGVKDVGRDEGSPHYIFGGRKAYPDPWANYRYGKIEELCPDFKGRVSV